jgi:hypothetical protein
LSDSLNEANKESLKKDINNGKIIPFVGAGVSQSLILKGSDNKLPFKSWKDLLKTLATIIIDENDKNHIDSYFELKDIDYLEIADKIKKFSNQIDYSKKLEEVITTDYDLIDKSSYILAKNIWKLNLKFIITTNNDSVLEKTCESDNVQAFYLDNNFNLSQVVSDELTKPTVWKYTWA